MYFTDRSGKFTSAPALFCEEIQTDSPVHMVTSGRSLGGIVKLYKDWSLSCTPECSEEKELMCFFCCLLGREALYSLLTEIPEELKFTAAPVLVQEET